MVRIKKTNAKAQEDIKMNTWQFIDGDIILSSDDEEQMKLAGEWIIALSNAIRLQVLEEVKNGRTNNESGQPESGIQEVTC